MFNPFNSSVQSFKALFKDRSLDSQRIFVGRSISFSQSVQQNEIQFESTIGFEEETDQLVDQFVRSAGQRSQTSTTFVVIVDVQILPNGQGTFEKLLNFAQMRESHSRRNAQTPQLGEKNSVRLGRRSTFPDRTSSNVLHEAMENLLRKNI